MFKNTAVFTKPQPDESEFDLSSLQPGHLLINDSDEIIYANKQACHYLGLLAEENLPIGQKFLPLAKSAYHCFPTLAWVGWPERPSATPTRYLIYTSPQTGKSFLLKVEIVEQFYLDGREIMVLAMNAVKSTPETAAAVPTLC